MLHCGHTATFSSVLLFDWVVFRLQKGKILLFHLDRFGCILQIINKQKYILEKHLSHGHIVNIFLKFRKFQPQYSYKVFRK